MEQGDRWNSIEEKIEKEKTNDFKFVVNKLSKIEDLCAFLILSKFVKNERDIVSGADHDEIYLEATVEDIERDATDDEIADLIRCGVVHSQDDEYLYMYV